MTGIVLDLAAYRSDGVRVFAGRARGGAIRTAADLPIHDAAGTPVAIRIPSDTITLTSGFTLGLLGDSVRALGLATFRARYTVEGPAHLVTSVWEDCASAATTASPFAGLQ